MLNREPSWANFLRAELAPIKEDVGEVKVEFRRLNGEVREVALWKAQQEGAVEERELVRSRRRWRIDAFVGAVGVFCIVIGGCIGWIGHAVGVW